MRFITYASQTFCYTNAPTAIGMGETQQGRDSIILHRHVYLVYPSMFSSAGELRGTGGTALRP